MDQEKHIPRSTKIFENKNVWTTLLKVMVPQILSSFISSLYILISQIFLNTIVPNDGVHTNEQVWANPTYKSIQEIWDKKFNGHWKDQPLQLETTGNIVHTAVAISIPTIVILMAIAIWISMGLSIIFGTAIGKKKTSEANKIWTSWFTPTFLFCAIISLIAGFSAIPLLRVFSGATHAGSLEFLNNRLDTKLDNLLTPFQIADLNNFYKIYYQTIVDYAFAYLLPIIITLVIQAFVMSTWFCLAAEGKQMIMVIVSLSCNLLNIVLDFTLMKYAKLGMLSGGLGIAITLMVNALFLIIYLISINKRSSTLMTLNFIKFRISWVIFVSTLIAGLASLWRNVSSALTLWIFQGLLVSTAVAVNTPATYWLNFGGAVMPIQNVLFSTSLGVVRGTKILFSYHLSAGNINYVKKVFLIGTLYALSMSLVLYGIIANAAVGIPIMKGLFGLDLSASSAAHDALKYMQIVFINVIMYGLMMVGMTFFQTAGRIINASLMAIFSGVGFAIVILPVMSAIAKGYGNEIIYISGLAVNSGVSGLFIFIFTSIYIKRKLKPGYQIHHPVEQFDNWLRKKHVKVEINQ